MRSVDEACERSGRTEEGVVRGDVSYRLAPHGVLLVREGEAGVRDVRQGVLIIQRCREGMAVWVSSDIINQSPHSCPNPHLAWNLGSLKSTS